jgi:4-diphosphocytidyl-2-C-methyl-D-erythritol kinase
VVDPVSSPLLRAKARAKINLFLHVTGRRANGYHELDSLVVFADIADELTVSAHDALHLNVTGRFAQAAGPDADNLVVRAAYALQQAAGITVGAALDLTKNIPAGAGLGGGSADAAAALQLLNVFWQLHFSDTALAEIGLSLGADIPVCLAGKPMRMTGIGEVLKPVPGLAPLHVVLTHPGTGLSTPAVFKTLAGRWSGSGPDFGAEMANQHGLLALLAATKNDLEAPAIDLAPEIGVILSGLRSQPDCLLARMSGSGSACFGLFPNGDAAATAANRLTIAHPGWWVANGQIG